MKSQINVRGQRAIAFGWVLFLSMTISVGMLAAQTAEEIITTMDKEQKYKTAKTVGSMYITDKYGVKQTDFISWSNENSDFLMEFTSAAEEGQKILRTGKVVYLFFPDAEDLMRLQGSSLKQGMMGSDISYEDMTEGNSTLDKYDVKKLDDIVVDEIDCWAVELIGKTRAVPYYRRIVYIDKSNYLPKKEEYFSKSGKLLKEMTVQKIEKYNELWMITELTITDKLKKSSSTRMKMSQVQLNIPVDKNLFTVNNLTW